MSNIPQLLVHDHKDNVGVVVVEGLTAGTDMLCVVTADNSSFNLTVIDDVPIGHKVALKDLSAGDTAIAMGLIRAKGTDSSGKPFNTGWRYTDTWVKMPNGQWQCVASHSSPVGM